MRRLRSKHWHSRQLHSPCAGMLTSLLDSCQHPLFMLMSPDIQQPPAHVQQKIIRPTCSASVQAALPCLLFASPTGGRDVSTLDLRGGTDAAFAPPVGDMQHILLPTLRRLLDIDVTDKVCGDLMCQITFARHFSHTDTHQKLIEALMLMREYHICVGSMHRCIVS